MVIRDGCDEAWSYINSAIGLEIVLESVVLSRRGSKKSTNSAIISSYSASVARTLFFRLVLVYFFVLRVYSIVLMVSRSLQVGVDD